MKAFTKERIEALRSRLSPEKRALLEERLRGDGDAVADSDVIPRRPAGEPPVISPAQQRLWFLERLTPGTAVFNVPGAVGLAGRLDAGALGRSLAEIVRRHENLRTRFAEEDGRPRPIIHPLCAWPLPRVDLAAVPPDRQPDEARRLAAAEARRPFDLAREPLLRTTLVRLGDDQQVLVVNLHHIVADAFSMGVFFRELVTLYASFAAGKPSPLPELRVQYADFARWQRRRFAEDTPAESLAYWQRQLAGSPTVLELPADRPRPAMRNLRGAILRIVLPGGLCRRLKALGLEHRASLFMTTLAAFKVLLTRYTGQGDVVVGSVIANRERAEIEGLIGFLLNTLVLRSDLADDPSFAQLLDRVRRMALDAFSHQELPFETLVEALRPERHLSHNPLFQVAFQLLNEPAAVRRLERLAMSEIPVHTGAAQFDLTLNLVEREGEEQVTGWFEYSRDLFDAATIIGLARHFRTLLAGIADDAGRRLSEVPLLNDAERWQILAEWNDTRGAFTSELTLHGMFEAQAHRTPEARAICFQPPATSAPRELSYGELNRRANRLAHHLRELGVGRGDYVGVYLERSPEMVTAVLAILKAAAAYLPIDRRWPAERVRVILESLGIRCLLTDSTRMPAVLDLQWRLPHLSDVVCLDVETPELRPEPLDAEAVRGIWELVVERAVDWITAGGFLSSYTGEPFSTAEVLEYRDRVVELAEPFLGPSVRVLEIGCGSGLLLAEITPRVASYVGLDPSPRMLGQTRSELWAGQVELVTGFAHEIESRTTGPFDLVLMASTVQFFPGPIYLERVLEAALRLLRPGGAILVADVMDARRREEFRASLEAFRKQHGGDGGRTRSRTEGALYLDEGLFHDFAAAQPAVAGVEVHSRQTGFDNELRYRYDVVVRKAEARAPTAVDRPRRKRWWTAWHLAARSPDDLRVGVGSGDLAYAIFTSGSTGVPKGVVVRHQPVINLIEWVNRSFRVGAGDRLLFTTSLCFDLSVYDLFGILAAGGTIDVASEAEVESPERLAERLLTGPITFWDSAPAALQQLVPLFAGAGESRQLRLVFLSGDWIPVQLPDEVRESFPGARVISLGGATEATVWSNCFAVREVDPLWASIPYGRPIRNARYYLLDRRLRPCPTHVAGDLYIGGECLCSGYAGDSGLTAEKFLPDPFYPAAGGPPGARMYATGDRARFRPDGNIEFLGRLDHQVKIRGFRIELGEIASTLDRHPAVEQTAVLVDESAGRSRRLVAYVAPREWREADREPLTDELRRFLGERLPDYMMPAVFIFLETLPVTANGKLDRQALPAPAELPAAGFAAPRTPAEKALADIWTEVLGTAGPASRRVGIHDNFFELGGDSILSVQIIARANRAGLELTPRDLFQHQTIAELAGVAGEPAGTAPEVAAAEPDLGRIRELVAADRPIADAYPLSPFQQLMLAQYRPRDEPGLFLINLDFLIRGVRLDPDRFRRAWQRVIDHHPVLRTSFVWEGVDEPLQLVHEGAAVELVEEDWRDLGEAELRERLPATFAAECRRGIPLRQAPHTRLALIRISEDATVFIWTINLMLQDGWSFPIILNDFFAAYDALLAGREPLADAEGPTPYRDYVALTRRLDPARAEEFWRRNLAGFTSPTPVVERVAGTFEPGEEGVVIKHATEMALTTKAALGEITRRHKVTLYTMAAAAWALLLRCYTGHHDVVFGIWVSTRPAELADADAMVGNFLNFLPLRLEIRDDRPLLGWLEEIQARLLELRRWELTPPALIKAWSQVPDELPLYESYLVFESFPLAASLRERATRWDMSFTYSDVGRTGVPLRVEVHPAEGLMLMMQYYRRFFDAAAVERRMGDFKTLLEAVAADPEQELAALVALIEAA